MNATWLGLQTLEYLQYPFARHALAAAILVALASATLSNIVVLKRMAFVGQGISHAAFGGIGVVAVLGLGEAVGELTIFLFCLGSALLMARLARHRTHEDTAIGIVLVGAMAVGFLLLGLRQSLVQHAWYREFISGAPPPAGWDSILFGSVHLAGESGMWLSIAVLIIVGAAVWWHRRPLLSWVFDEVAAEASGVSPRRMRSLLLVLLALVVVVGMKLVGVVLISALLVLPGAIAAQLTARLRSTIVLTHASAVFGVVGGLVLSFEADLASGPCIVLVLTTLFAIAAIVRRFNAA